MPGAARKEDVCTGHDCYPSRANDQASGDTFANNRGAHRQGDHWRTHCCGSCHDAKLAQGSPDVLVNSKPWGRCNDKVSCKSKVGSCSPDVILN